MSEINYIFTNGEQAETPVSGLIIPANTYGVTVPSFAVKDGYIVVQNLAELSVLMDDSHYPDRNLTAKVYSIDDKKTYLYQDGSYVEDPEFQDLISYIDERDSSIEVSIEALKNYVDEKDNSLSDRITFIENDYLDSSDKIELEELISTVDHKLDLHIEDSSNPHHVTKAQVELGNVDNTSDIDKPVSTAQQAALDLKADKTYVDNNFLNKTTDQDQVIQSNVFINGDLTVAGTEHITDVETIESQSNLIIVNSNNTPLQAVGGAGIIARTGNQDDSTEAYAVAYYDAIKDSVVLGLGHYSDDSSLGKSFVLTDGESIATRADDSQMIDGNIPQWNASRYTFVDSGKSVDNFVDKIAATNTYLIYAVRPQSLGGDNTSIIAGQYDGTLIPGNFRIQMSGIDGTFTVGNPTRIYHATNKNYVDTNFVKILAGRKAIAYGNDGNGDLTTWDIRDAAVQASIAYRRSNGTGQLSVAYPTLDGDATNKEYVDDAIYNAFDELNIEDGTGSYSLLQKETITHQGQATGRGAIVFGGFRGDKPNNTPNTIPNDDASVNNLDQDAYNDTVPKVVGIQSAVFGAGNRAYGDWNFIAGKDSKTTSRGSFAFGGKNYVGDPLNTSKYLWSMAVGGLNVINSDYSFAAGSKNHLLGSYSMGLGYDNTLRGASAKAIGNGNLIDNSGGYSVAIGNGLLIDLPLQIALGNYNIPGDVNALLVLGNGTSGAERSNAFEVTKTGIARAYGTPNGSYDLTPKSYVDSELSTKINTSTIDQAFFDSLY